MEAVHVDRCLEWYCKLRPVLAGTVVWRFLPASGRLLKQPSVEICEGTQIRGQADHSSVSLAISTGSGSTA